MSTYIDADPEAGREFYVRYKDSGPIIMLNMLQFKINADYTGMENLEPAREVTGLSAYRTYLEKTRPCLDKIGSRILYYGKCSSFLIGPSEEKWDAILLVEHTSVAKFMELVRDLEYLRHAGHRIAALEDSRLLPTLKGQESP